MVGISGGGTTRGGAACKPATRWLKGGHMTIFDIAFEHQRQRLVARDIKFNPYGLTPRQQRIGRLLLDGLSRRQIADTLGEVVGVISRERAAMMRKTRARNGCHLLHLLCVLGQMPPPVPQFQPVGDLRDTFGRAATARPVLAERV